MKTIPSNQHVKAAPVREVCAIPYPAPMNEVIEFAQFMQTVEAHTGGIASHRVNGNMQSFMLEGGK